MNDKRRLSVARSTLTTILLEAKEPIIRAMAQSALDETKDIEEEQTPLSYCKKHKWFGLPIESCPECKTE